MIIRVLLVVAILAALTACGRKGAPVPPSQALAEAEEG